jgi:uncharacterized protein YfaQ (DUF2300 family)
MIQRALRTLHSSPAGKAWRVYVYAYFAGFAEGRARS